MEKTYGTVIRDLQTALGDEVANRVTLWDSKIKGRPDIGELIADTVRAVDAEVVIITSNPKGTADALRACKSRGIPAHGPVWDS